MIVRGWMQDLYGVLMYIDLEAEESYAASERMCLGLG